MKQHQKKTEEEKKKILIIIPGSLASWYAYARKRVLDARV